MASVEKKWNISRHAVAGDQTEGGSKLSSLTDPVGVGKISYLTATDVVVKSPTNLDGVVTGIVFSIGRGALATGTPWYDPANGKQNNGPNQIGDPAEVNYSLTDSDFRVGTSPGLEADGGAQKFVNALLDSAYVAYNSGVDQGSGLNSMTVSRGNLSLTNSSITGLSGIVNTYSRSYSVTFNYKQSGMITAGSTAAKPDITNDLSTELGDGPF